MNVDADVNASVYAPNEFISVDIACANDREVQLRHLIFAVCENLFGRPEYGTSAGFG